MNERIRAIREKSGLNQTDFGARLGVKQTTIAGYENGTRTPIDAVLLTICREFHVNEKWLRTGQGDPYIQLSRDDELSQFFGEVMKEEDPDFRRRLLSVMSRLTTDEWALLEQMAWKLVDELRQDSVQEASSEEGKKNPGPP